MRAFFFFLVVLLFEKRELEKQKGKERRKQSPSVGVCSTKMIKSPRSFLAVMEVMLTFTPQSLTHQEADIHLYITRKNPSNSNTRQVHPLCVCFITCITRLLITWRRNGIRLFFSDGCAFLVKQH